MRFPSAVVIDEIRSFGGTTGESADTHPGIDA
jgi:hypothetical protein